MALVAVPALLGCGGRWEPGSTSSTDGPTRTEFALRLTARERISPEQAACVTDYVFDENPLDVIEQLYDGGLKSVSMAHWNSYGHSMVACALADDLNLERSGPRGGADG